MAKKPAQPSTKSPTASPRASDMPKPPAEARVEVETAPTTGASSAPDPAPAPPKKPAQKSRVSGAARGAGGAARETPSESTSRRASETSRQGAASPTPHGETQAPPPATAKPSSPTAGPGIKDEAAPQLPRGHRGPAKSEDAASIPAPPRTDETGARSPTHEPEHPVAASVPPPISAKAPETRARPLPEPPEAPPALHAPAQVQPPLGEPHPARAVESAPEPAQTPHSDEHPGLFVIHITPEMAPVAKVGGLADVVFGLSRELAIRGNHVEIILPKYDNLRYDHIFQMHEVYRDLWVPWYDGAIHCTVYFSFVHDRKCFFIEPHSQDNFFSRGALYGFPDDVLRFAFFSRAAMEFLWKAGKHPDVIHCHDWQTALVPVFLYEIYQPMGMHHPRVCLTIHNFKHQGVTGAELLRATGLHPPERYMAYERLADNNHPGALNLLKGGIVYSNFVATVSPRYAFETKDQGQGFGLEPTLHSHHMKYGGVVNGIDYDVWNPEVDHHIPVRYGIDSIDGKYDDKRALRHRLMLADNEKPIVAFIGRLDPQKGLELVRHAIFHSLEKGAQFVLLGSSPDPGINADFWGLKHMLNDSPDCHLEVGFDEDLAHLIYAGADMMLVPSQFEPCGLTQLISLRYGTIPVVRSIGGLADTVFDKDNSPRPLHERNGYSFETYDAQGLESALGRAIDCYYQYPEHFRELMRNAMRSDYSWNHPGQDYLNVYEFIRNR